MTTEDFHLSVGLMFHGFITSLTLLAMVLHAFLGCCNHHPHTCCQSWMGHVAETEDLACHVRAKQKDCSTCSHSHNAAQAQSTGSDGIAAHATVLRSEASGHDRHQHGHDGCDETTCKYVGNSSPKMPTPVDGFPVVTWLSPVDGLAAHLLTRVRRDLLCGDSLLDYAAGPSVRDVTQSWLL